MFLLESMYQIGKHEIEGYDFATRIPRNPKVLHLIKLQLGTNLDKITGTTSITGFSVQISDYEYSRDKEKYPYRRPPSNGSGITPFAKVTDIKKPGRTLNGKIIKWYDNLLKSNLVDVKVPIYQLMVETHTYLTNNFSKVEARLKDELNSNEDSKFLLVIDYKSHEMSKKFLNFIKKHFIDNAFIGFSEKHNTKSLGQGECFYCCMKTKVNGFATPYSFYTHDKVTYSSNFQIKDAWKQFPVCNRCAIVVENGAEKVETDFSHKFYGVNYRLFPKSVNEKNFSKLIKKLEKFYLKDSSSDRTKQHSAVDDSAAVQKEEILIRRLKEFKNDITFTFLFYYEENSAFVILSVINDVLPSRFSILDKQRKILSESLLLNEWHNAFFKSQRKNYFSLKFGYLRKLFPPSEEGESGKNDIYRQQFLELTGTAFRGNKISSSALIQPAVKRLQHLFSNRNEGHNEHGFFVFVLRAFAIVDYFYKIGCINNFKKVDKTMSENKLIQELGLTKSLQVKRIQKLFMNFEYFDGTEKMGIFILGILVQHVAWEQYDSIGSSPFYESLDGLRLTKRKVKQLFPKVIGKLLEYRDEINWIEVKALETLASHYFMQGNLDLPTEEICFSFALGLSCQPILWAKSSKEDEKK